MLSPERRGLTERRARWTVRLARGALALAAAASLWGCGKNAVRASEKEFLADQTMVFDSDSQEATADDHVAANREGSAGGRSTGGGGCGCN